jgi:hypothetical protein
LAVKRAINSNVTNPLKVGQTVIAKIGGIPQEAKIRAVLESTDELIVDFGYEQVATIHERNIVAQPNS